MTASGPPAARCATPKAPRAASYTTTRDTAGADDGGPPLRRARRPGRPL